ncbi:DUF6953 family protein [Bradyrhizobium embrapense]
MATVDQVAQWMFEDVNRKGMLEQETAAHEIQRRFGKGFIYNNENGNPAIDRKVLAAFRKLSGDGIVWDRSYKAWRRRETYDLPGRQQD